MTVFLFLYLIAFSILYFIFRKEEKIKLILLILHYMICSIFVVLYTDHIYGLVTGGMLIIAVIGMTSALKQPWNPWLVVVGAFGLLLMIIIQLELPYHMLISSSYTSSLVLLAPLSARLIDYHMTKKTMGILTFLILAFGIITYINPVLGVEAGTKQSNMASDYIEKYYRIDNLQVDPCQSRRGQSVGVRVKCRTSGKCYELVYKNNKIIQSEVCRKHLHKTRKHVE